MRGLTITEPSPSSLKEISCPLPWWPIRNTLLGECIEYMRYTVKIQAAWRLPIVNPPTGIVDCIDKGRGLHSVWWFAGYSFHHARTCPAFDSTGKLFSKFLRGLDGPCERFRVLSSEDRRRSDLDSRPRQSLDKQDPMWILAKETTATRRKPSRRLTTHPSDRNEVRDTSIPPSTAMESASGEEMILSRQKEPQQSCNEAPRELVKDCSAAEL